MAIVTDPALEEARSQLNACRSDIMRAVRRLQAMSNPPPDEVPNMCTAVLELFATQIQFEEAELARAPQANVQAIGLQVRSASTGSSKLQSMRESVRALRESVAAMDRTRTGTR